MNKFVLVLIFSFIAFTKGVTTVSVDDFNTEPYQSFDWLDKDENTFKVKLTSQVGDNSFCYLYNSSKVCKPDCSLEDKKKTLSCKLKGDDCKGDKDNPTFKYYYAVYCYDPSFSDSQTDTAFTKNLTASQILAKVTVGNDVGVTIAICSGSYLKYSLFLLSLLIL